MEERGGDCVRGGAPPPPPLSMSFHACPLCPGFSSAPPCVAHGHACGMFHSVCLVHCIALCPRPTTLCPVCALLRPSSPLQLLRQLNTFADPVASVILDKFAENVAQISNKEAFLTGLVHSHAAKVCAGFYTASPQIQAHRPAAELLSAGEGGRGM